MIFTPAIAKKVLDGTKTVTRRACTDNPRSPWYRKECGLAPGSIAAFTPGRGKPAVGRVRILDVRREKLGRLPIDEVRREGFDSVERFEVIWSALNGRYDPTMDVWRIEFELVP